MFKTYTSSLCAEYIMYGRPNRFTCIINVIYILQRQYQGYKIALTGTNQKEKQKSNIKNVKNIQRSLQVSKL